MEVLKVCQFFVIFCFMSFGECAVGFGPAEVNPDYPNSCWDKDLKVAIKVGEDHQAPNCVRVSCTFYHDKHWLEYYSCGTVGVPEECTTVQDFSKPYPECCPQPSCPKSETTNLLGKDYIEFKNWVDTYYDYTPTEYV